ncbi:hypothetical protein CR105_17745 [Massilia eurypsychrophila]|jgi:hypothetical protein|uniref:DUF2059 domain-containing protein n=2 Tax=Massilia eurypsychrophila TaxID=1485217 RepID=A0A2G8TC26_9BURK|nr:hypothetical protein CR105_17745 [Massilia eurypsychrophila]
MRLMTTLSLAALIAASPVSFAAPPAAAPVPAPAAGVITVGHVNAVSALLKAMQAEKMMRSITGSSRYANDTQRQAAYAKLEKVPPAQIYARLAYPLARTISAETATEMARFYASDYGKKVVHQMYNSGPSMGAPRAPISTPAERKDMQRPAFIKANKALAEAQSTIRHEGFVLLQAIAK